MVLKEASASICDLVWLIDSGEKDATWNIRLLRKLGVTIDIAGMTMDEVTSALRPLEPDAIAAYADDRMATASALADRLGLVFHDEEVVQRVIDKSEQRKALRKGGLSVPSCHLVPPRAGPKEINDLVEAVTFPVVMKPRLGAASRDTNLVHDATQLRDFIAQVQTDTVEPMMVLENYMVGASPPPSEHFGDYVSVESVVVDGSIMHLAVTGRPHQAKPFRETGLFIPSDFSTSLQAEVLHLATDAIRVLGIQVGCLHTEIKITDVGPRVIEVNCRIGGFVPEVLARAAPGVNLNEIVLRVALGQPIDYPTLVPTANVGYAIVRQPPQWARRVTGIEGLDEVSNYPGVDLVTLSRRPGDPVDWRLGSHEYVFSVLGAVPDHASVSATEAHIDEKVTVTYE
jgi:biotin carboxylase